MDLGHIVLFENAKYELHSVLHGPLLSELDGDIYMYMCLSMFRTNQTLDHIDMKCWLAYHHE